MDLAKTDPGNALAAMAKLPDDYGTWVMTALHQLLVDTDPFACAEWLKGFSARSQNQVRLATNIFGMIASRNPTMAFDALSAYDPKARRMMIGAGVQIWTQQSGGDAVISVIKTELKGGELETALHAVVGSVAVKDPEKALLLAAEIPRDLIGRVLPDVFGLWVMKEGHLAVVDALLQTNPAVAQSVLEKNGLIGKIAADAPESAMDLLARIPFTSGNTLVFESAAKEIAKSNPKLANEWLETFPSSSGKDNLINAVFEGWSMVSPDAAFAAANAMQGESRSNALAGIGHTLGKTSFDAGFDTLNRLPPADQAMFLGSLAAGASSRGPETTIQLLTDSRTNSQLLENSSATEALSGAMRELATRDTTSALGMLDRVPESQRPPAVFGLVSGWARADPQSASKWLIEQPEGPSRHSGIEAMVKILEPTDPDAARRWIGLLPSRDPN